MARRGNQMSRFVAPSTPCPYCDGSTIVLTGEHIKAGYRRRRQCHHCGCRFIALQEKGAIKEKILLVQVMGNVPKAEPEMDDDDTPEIEPEPGSNWGVEQMRRALLVGAFDDVKWFRKIEPDTLALSQAIRQKKARTAA